MKKFLAAILCVMMTPFATSALAVDDTNVTILVRSDSGSAVSDGYSAIDSKFLNETKVINGGEVRFRLPNGMHKFSLRSVANPLDENLTYYTFYWEMEINGQTQVELVLPKVTSTRIGVEGASAEPHVMVLRLGSYDSRSTESASGNDSSGTWAMLKQNGTATQVPGTRLSIDYSVREANGQLVPDMNYFEQRGVLVEGGAIDFSIFETKSLATEDPWRIKTADTFDFDGDGYTDFSYSYKYGAFGWKSGRLSRASVLSGDARFFAEGSTYLRITSLPKTGKLDASKSKSFKVEGVLESADKGFLTVNSPINAMVLTRQNQGGGRERILSISVGTATVDPDGTFSLDVLIPAFRNTVGTTFQLRTPLGYGTVSLDLPTFESKLVRQKTLSKFGSSSTVLSAKQKTEIRDALNSSPNAKKFICTGIRFESAPLSDNLIVRTRAKEACDYAKELNPTLSTWFQNKPTKVRSYAGKVLLTIKN
jgi:hypothetical protein